MSALNTTLPTARTNNTSGVADDPSIIAASGSKLPQLTFRALRIASALESLIKFTGTAPTRIMGLAPALESKRYVRQVWLYGIASFSGLPALPNANVSLAYWGWSPQSLVNEIPQWAGGYGQLIQPPDMYVDLWSLWFAGAVGDGVFLTVL